LYNNDCRLLYNQYIIKCYLFRSSVIKRETLTNSIQNRKIELLTITTEKQVCVTTSNHHKQEHQSRRAVVIFGRVHPGESPTSFVCQGLIDFLVSAHPIAKVLRNYIVFKVIPMLNPDGVCFGNHRYDVELFYNL
jgi:murein tripeptide amidase MpaA